MQKVIQFQKARTRALKAVLSFDFPFLPGKRSLLRGQGKRSSQSGQIIFEFVLLIVVCLTLITLISSRIVSRDPNSPGLLISKWSELSQAIGSDIID